MINKNALLSVLMRPLWLVPHHVDYAEWHYDEYIMPSLVTLNVNMLGVMAPCWEAKMNIHSTSYDLLKIIIWRVLFLSQKRL